MFTLPNSKFKVLKCDAYHSSLDLRHVPRFKEALKKNNLKVIFMIFTDGAVCPGTGKTRYVICMFR